MTLSAILAAKCRGLSEGSSGGGVRSLRRPLLTKVKMSATFSMVSTSVRYCSAEHSLAEVGSENRIFHCLSTVLLQNSVDIETAQAKEMCCFYNERFTLFCCVHTYRNPFYAPFLHSSGMSSGTYVHGKSP